MHNNVSDPRGAAKQVRDVFDILRGEYKGDSKLSKYKR